MRYTYDDLAKMIDHSLLHPTMTDRELAAGCRLARKYKVASVCIKPYAVKAAARLLRGSGVAVGAVVGFPHGSSTTESKRFETETACRDGATEIDMVINVGKALSGDFAYVEKDIRAVVREAHKRGAIVKVIFENDFLQGDAIKKRLCRISENAGADYVKTSTGYGFVKGADGTYGYEGATEHDLVLMRKSVSRKVQVKAAGGVRDLDALMHVRDLGTTRCGATATAAMLDEYRRRARMERQGRRSSQTGSPLGSGGY
jgi:deoxyribose-phosphate aldolase